MLTSHPLVSAQLTYEGTFRIHHRAQYEAATKAFVRQAQAALDAAGLARGQVLRKMLPSGEVLLQVTGLLPPGPSALPTPRVAESRRGRSRPSLV